MAQISQADAKQYDRQIRLWGAQAQQRLSESRVLLIGISSLGAEVAKNIVLAGVKSLCIFDPTVVTCKDSSSIFLFRPTDHGSRVRHKVLITVSRASHPAHSERYLCHAKASRPEPSMSGFCVPRRCFSSFGGW
jgi:ubiquitin-like 1-activating enzyme E1 A